MPVTKDELLLINQKTLVKDVAKKLDIFQNSIQTVVDCLEETIREYLLQADANENIEIKLFEGIKLKSKFVPAHKDIHPETKEEIMVDDKVWITSKVTRNLNRKLNEQRGN